MVVAGYGVLNITMARVAIINYVNEAAPSQSNCEVMKQVPGLGQPRIHEYGEYWLRLPHIENINTKVITFRAINIIVIHNNPLTKLGEGDQFSTLALNYSQPPLTSESKVRSDYKIFQNTLKGW